QSDAWRGICRSGRSDHSGGISRRYWNFSFANLARRHRPDGCRHFAGEFDCIRRVSAWNYSNWSFVLLISFIYLVLVGVDPGPALLFTAYMVPVNLLDNFLRPIVMGRGLKTPMLVILIGVIGGTLAYGITGLFLGPIVLAVIWELFVTWIEERENA